MNRQFLKQLFFLVLMVGSVCAAKAQKFGHVNVGNLLVLMPETKEADSKLKVFQDSLVAIGQRMADSLQADIQAFAAEYRAGNLTPIAAQKKQEELEQRHQQVQQYEQQVLQWVSAKREELIAPILDKLQNAIDAVGKEHGYYMIFDTSIMNAILYASESDDVSALVLAKLGIDSTAAGQKE